ncbi:TonB-dependent receptor plug domain-containing protein [Caulobacter sp. 1776]|uniref:TonB-dependent receptor plug domain-containing protein n=1 Tax=Caulobacter sp. 1776 TaxID=3156420 RepID=UPI003394863B
MALAASALVATAVQAQSAATSAAPAPVKAETNAVDEVIVTGVMAGTAAKKANVSFSVLSEDDMSKFTPISADDMLRDMPGVVVESNDGVARNEVFTRGMTIGTGANTSGYFWTTILEDGLPVVPFKFSGFQDGYFYRADISTSRVESVRGGSSATGVTTSVGATFNYITGQVKPGAVIQTRLGFEGEDLHLSWKQVDAAYGWVNQAGDFGVGLSGFYRRSNGQVNPGWDLNHGGQFKLNLYKDYKTANGSGSFNVVLKHLDDTNAELTTFQQPTYGYQNPEEIPGFGRDVNLFMNGGKQTVPNAFRGGTHTLDPSDGYRYRQDAISLRWNHDTDGPLSFTGALRVQKSRYRGQSYKPQGLASLGSGTATRERYGLNINNLDRTPGYYEYYNGAGALVARVANNVNGSQLGVNYRTNAACPRVTATTWQSNSLCLVSNTLPNRNVDMRGGLVTATIPTAAGVYNSGVVPVDSASQDLILLTRAEDNQRESNDYMGNFTATYHGDNYSLNLGVYVSRSEQENDNWANGLGVSAWADGQVQNLNVKYVTDGGTTYQLTDAGGWGSYGSGLFTTVSQRAKIREISPYAGASWSPGKWDFNGSVKYQRFDAKTYSETWDTRNANAASLTNGGLDGDPLTVYDNVYMTKTAAKVIEADKHVGTWNYSVAVGYNFNARNKVYYRYTDAKQPAAGVINRYSSAAALVRPLGPTAFIKGHEVAYTFGDRKFNGQITYFYQNFAVNDYPTAVDKDNVSTYLLPENFNRYFTRGVEAWAKWRITRALEWNPSATFLNGKTTEAYTWLNTGANGQGDDDDVLRIDAGILARSPKWTISNTVSYSFKDFRFNLRHRWMDVRKLNNNALDHRYLPKQDNLDASVQYTGMKKTLVTLDVRNVLDKQYISAYDPMISTNLPANVQIYDVVAQLPESGFLLKRNAPRSVWLTVRKEF